MWILCSIFCLIGGSAFAAYLENVPVTLTQPDGTVLECFATGDEYYNWVHDKDGYTIVQNPTTGYYCYAILQGDELVASQYVVGKTNPLNTMLKPHVNISSEKISAQRESILKELPPKTSLTKSSQSKAATGALNNIVVYIRFADQTEFSAEQNIYTSLFNGETGNSMKNYFREITHNRLSINSYFYPQNNGSTILSYQDSHERNYYCPYNAVSNPVGYKDNEETTREHNLLANAINYIKDQIPASLNLDYDNDGYVDNICFIIKGSVTSSWNTILWPHRWGLYTKTITINGKRVYDYNLQLENSLKPSNNGVLCHEIGHTLGAPDLYHYPQNNRSVAGVPVGAWDVMASNQNPPQYMSAHIKQKYMGWISSIPIISSPGTYTLNPSSSATNNCYRIPLINDNEYLVLEYRKKTGIFESSIPNSGLIIYRINTNYRGNSNGNGYANTKDEIYVFRPNGSISSDGNIGEAYFSIASGRTKFGKSTNPYCILSSGIIPGNVYIRNIRENSNGTLSFELGCVDEEIVYSNTSSLPSHTIAKGRIKTSGSVVVKANDNITFEATDDIILNAGFEIQKGGVFQTIGDACE